MFRFLSGGQRVYLYVNYCTIKEDVRNWLAFVLIKQLVLLDKDQCISLVYLEINFQTNLLVPRYCFKLSNFYCPKLKVLYAPDTVKLQMLFLTSIIRMYTLHLLQKEGTSEAKQFRRYTHIQIIRIFDNSKFSFILLVDRVDILLKNSVAASMSNQC